MDLKQELIRCLLAILHSQPHLVPRVVEHARVVEIKCPSTGSDVPVNARDIFWALMNATQRDPVSPLAVEWTLLLLSLLLKPINRSNDVIKARDIMFQRIAQLKPTATLREQLKSLPDIPFLD